MRRLTNLINVYREKITFFSLRRLFRKFKILDVKKHVEFFDDVTNSKIICYNVLTNAGNVKVYMNFLENQKEYTSKEVYEKLTSSPARKK